MIDNGFFERLLYTPMSFMNMHTAVFLCVALFLPSAHAQKPFSFVALGDLPYGSAESSYQPYRALIDRINLLEPAFSVHVGDIKSGSTLCSDEEFVNQKSHFQRFTGAVVYTPGDNEWTDCHRANNGSYDPLERLKAIRDVFFDSNFSLGLQPLRVQSQAHVMPQFGKYVENLRWQHQKILFVTLHLVGSNNNFESRQLSAVTEFFERDEANVTWIKAGFDLARKTDLDAIVFFFQADVFEQRTQWDDFPSWSGFRRSMAETLLPLAQSWAKPVLVIHGDSHHFKIDQPFQLNKRPLRNVTRLIVPGATDVRAVRVTVKGASFSFELISSAPE